MLYIDLCRFISTVPKAPNDCVVIIENPCKELKKEKCAVNYNKPRYCKEFPDLNKFSVLPKKCRYAHLANAIIEDLILNGKLISL